TLQVEFPESVSVPAPASVPPDWVKVPPAVTEAFPLTLSVPPDSAVLPPRVAPFSSVKLPPWKLTRPPSEPLKLPFVDPVLPPFRSEERRVVQVAALCTSSLP